MLKKFILLVVGVTLLSFSALYTYYRTEYSAMMQRQYRDIQLHLNVESERFKLSLAEVYSDVRYLQRSLQHCLLETPDRLKQNFLYFSTEKKRYDQIRFLDATGMEQIRINYKEQKPYLVDDSGLQNKAERYYFKKAINLPQDTIYQSPLDLNIEHGVIEIPYKPMIRFSTPIYTPDHTKRGLLVLNYLAGNMLQSIKQSPKHFSETLFLLDHNAYYLSGARDDELWGFMFNDKTDATFAKAHPDIWAQMQHAPSGTLENTHAIFIYTTITLPHSERIVSESNRWYFVAQIEKKLIANAILKKIFVFSPLIFVVYIILSTLVFIIIRNRETRLKQAMKIRNLNQSIARERDLFISGPTLVFKLENTQGLPIEYVSSNIKELLGFDSLTLSRERRHFNSLLAPEYIDAFSRKIDEAHKQSGDALEHEPFEILDSQGIRHWVRDHIRLVRNSNGTITHIYGYINDISHLKEAENRLRQNNHYIQTVLDTIADPTIVIDVATYDVVLCNKAARELYPDALGTHPYGKCYRMWSDTPTTCNDPAHPCPLNKLQENGTTLRVTHRHLDRDGIPFYIEISATPIFDEHGTITQIIESHHDISQHIAEKEKLKTLAQTDLLTHTFNRVKLDELLDKAIHHAKKSGSSFGLIMLDIDHFKNINDTYGHDVGDSVLVELTGLIQKRIRKDDTLMRWGGEEFLLFIPDAETQLLRTIAESLRETICAYHFENVGSVTCSFGASTFLPEDTRQTLFKRIDTALYNSKNSGRNKVSVI